jgi:hypothetical protein
MKALGLQHREDSFRAPLTIQLAAVVSGLIVSSQSPPVAPSEMCLSPNERHSIAEHNARHAPGADAAQLTV